MHYGLINITTKYQDPEYQKKLIKEYCSEEQVDYLDDYSSLLSICKEGDIIVMQDILKLYDTTESRPVSETILNRYQELFNKGIEIIILEEPFLNSSLYKDAIIQNNDLKNHAASAVSFLLQKQINAVVENKLNKKSIIRQNIKNSIKNNRENLGKKKGRHFITQKEIESKEYMKIHLIDLGGDMTDRQMMESLHIARNTFYKYKRELIKKISPDISEKKESKKEKNRIKKEMSSREDNKEKSIQQMTMDEFL